jgi:hypothetical protein
MSTPPYVQHAHTPDSGSLQHEVSLSDPRCCLRSCCCCCCCWSPAEPWPATAVLLQLLLPMAPAQHSAAVSLQRLDLAVCLQLAVSLQRPRLLSSAGRELVLRALRLSCCPPAASPAELLLPLHACWSRSADAATSQHASALFRACLGCCGLMVVLTASPASSALVGAARLPV